jgi:hypothetical protein
LLAACSERALVLPDFGVIAAPERVRVCAGAGEAKVVFDAVPGADGYRLYWNAGSSVTRAQSMAAQPPRTFVSGLPPGVAHVFAVSATFGGRESPLSASVSATPFAARAHDKLFAVSDGILIWDDYSRLSSGAPPTRKIPFMAGGEPGAFAVSARFDAVYATSRQDWSLSAWPASTANGDPSPSRTFAGAGAEAFTGAIGPLWIDDDRDRLYGGAGAAGTRIWDDACALDGGTAPAAVIEVDGMRLDMGIEWHPTYALSGDSQRDQLYVSGGAWVADVFEGASTLVGDRPYLPSRHIVPTAPTAPRIFSLDAVNDRLWGVTADSVNFFRFEKASSLDGTRAPAQISRNAAARYGEVTIQVAGDRLFISDDATIVEFDGASNKPAVAAPDKTLSVSAIAVFYLP